MIRAHNLNKHQAKRDKCSVGNSTYVVPDSVHVFILAGGQLSFSIHFAWTNKTEKVSEFMVETVNNTTTVCL